mgnify:CR=1 FL=1
MKKIAFTIGCGLLVLSSCTKDFDAEAYYKQKEEAKITANASQIFGNIDPAQDWNSITSGTITVTADAALNDIVKIQILTESPFLNDNAKVLAEADAKQGETVTLSYDAPNAYKKLIAACVNSKKHYYIQVFNVGDQTVNFKQAASSRTMRASMSEAPTFTTLKLKAPRWSFNALRAQQGATCKIGGNTYTEWANSNWNDQMWDLADNQTFDGGWTLDSNKDKGHIYRTVDGFAPGEQKNVEAILNSLFMKYASDEYSTNGKKNNARIIRNSTYVTQNKNYVYSDGTNPVTLIPLKAYNTEFKQDNIYYYYYKESEIPSGMSEVDYIKSLPKFKAIQVERVQTSVESNQGAIYRRQEFLLPYFKNAPVEGDNEASAIFPRGYKIGFLCMKHNMNNYNIEEKMNGCVYGDGRLNVEVNHIKDHFLTAIDKTLGGGTKDGMQFDDPRMAMFTANDKLYLCLESGSDCNFSDLVLEIGGGVDKLEEEIEPEAEAYTMCFEDRPATADYDLNDVVLRCTRVDKTTLALTLVATGANDDVFIHGATGWELNDQEVHSIFHAVTTDKNNRFVNTEIGGTKREVQSRYVTVEEGVKIPQYLKNIYIENKTTGKIIRVPEQGEAPYAIIVPQDFQYPMEHTRITEAYSNFLQWAQDANTDKDWYVFEDADQIFPSLFQKW